jgi:hypothetical protein
MPARFVVSSAALTFRPALLDVETASLCAEPDPCRVVAKVGRNGLRSLRHPNEAGYTQADARLIHPDGTPSAETRCAGRRRNPVLLHARSLRGRRGRPALPPRPMSGAPDRRAGAAGVPPARGRGRVLPRRRCATRLTHRDPRGVQPCSAPNTAGWGGAETRNRADHVSWCSPASVTRHS